MRGGGVWSWAESLNNSEIGSTKAQLLLASKLMTYQVTPPPFFSWQAFIHLVQKMWEMTRLATMWALALIDSETVVPKASSTSSSCHCPPSKHIVAPLPSFLKKKALHVLWYQKVDHSSWAVNEADPTVLIVFPFLENWLHFILFYTPVPIFHSHSHRALGKGLTLIEVQLWTNPW